MNKQLTVLTNDPSLTAWGYVVIKNGQPQRAGCIKTVPQNKKLRIRKGDDDARRVREILLALLQVIEEYEVNYILSELPHGSQSAAGMKMVGITITAVEALSVTLEIPVEWYSEGDAKKALLGKTAATKREVINAVAELYDVPWSGVKYKDEALADAMAVYHVATKMSNVLIHYNHERR